ncbi:MAG: PulJ/GspJ family protein [Trueperaceae bacterium]
MRKGFTLVELLVATAIFSIFLGALTFFFSSNSRISNQQMSSADANLALRQSLLRMTEIVTQASYIYPSGITVTLTNNHTALTGANALAVLVPAGTTYCQLTTAKYCGYVFSLENRANYINTLGAADVAGSALIEWRKDELVWNANTVPASTLLDWKTATSSPMADRIVPSNQVNGSNLAATTLLTLSQESPIFDDNSGVFSIATGSASNANGLIAAVAPRLVIQAKQGSGNIARSTQIFSRAIPRAGLPTP